MDVPPLIIAGMHRSGTSATARLLELAGLDVGGDLLAPSVDNALGYYEDLEFCDLNLALLAAGVGDDPRHRPDWAFAEHLVPERLEPLRPRAAALSAGRCARGRAWGFKDPRTTVLLDFYDGLMPGARYLFVYRAPWEVLTSILGTQDRPLRGRADVAAKAWATYNARLLEFRERHPERCVLVHVDAIAAQPEAVVRLAQVQLDALAPGTRLDAGAARDAFAGRLLRRADATTPLAELLAADHPEAMAVYARLQAAADIPGLDADLAPTEPPHVDVEALDGTLGAAGVLAYAPADGLEGTTRLARPAAGATPAAAADAGFLALPDELVVVVFAGQIRPDGLARAVAALQADPGLEAVLLPAGDVPGPAVAHDPLGAAPEGAAVVLRRGAWLATRGFSATTPPPGFEAWTLAVGCVAGGGRVARVDGALHLQGVADDDTAVRRQVLERHPALAASAALDALARAQRAERGATDAEAARDRLARDLEQLRATRAWRLAAGWWGLKARLGRPVRAG